MSPAAVDRSCATHGRATCASDGERDRAHRDPRPARGIEPDEPPPTYRGVVLGRLPRLERAHTLADTERAHIIRRSSAAAWNHSRGPQETLGIDAHTSGPAHRSTVIDR